MNTTKVIVLPTCAICRDDDDEEVSYVVTKCGHLFHTDCMKEWNRNERNRGGNARCPYCNTYLQAYDSYGGDSGCMTRLHQLIKHRVTILEDGKPSPEEELKGVRDNLNSIKVILNKETDKLRSTEAEKAKLDAENKALKSAIDKLAEEVKLNKEKSATRAAEYNKEKQNRLKEVAANSAEKQKLQKQIADAKQFYEQLRTERGGLQKELARMKGENGKLQGIMANQTNLISNLQAQSMQLVHERDQLVEKITALRQSNHGLLSQAQTMHSTRHQHLNPIQAIQSNQHFYQPPLVDPNQSTQLINVLQGLGGGFLKLEKEYMEIKKLLEEKNEKGGSRREFDDPEKENRQVQVHVDVIEDGFSDSSQAAPLTPAPSLEPVKGKGKGKEIQGLVQQMESLELPSASSAHQMIDPRLFG